MKPNNFIVLMVLSSLFIINTSFKIYLKNDNLPKGWFPAGQAPVDYEIGLDINIFHNGNSSGFIKSKPMNPIGFGTLMQKCQANEYIGKRIKMVSYIRTDKIKKWAGMWLRVDGPGKQILSFDNMKDRPIKGSTDWKKYEIILDVPKNSINLAFGILLDGGGKAWIDDISFETLDSIDDLEIPLKDHQENNYPIKPINLNFEN